MPNYKQAHQFYAGCLLPASSMFVYVLGARGTFSFGPGWGRGL